MDNTIFQVPFLGELRARARLVEVFILRARARVHAKPVTLLIPVLCARRIICLLPRVIKVNESSSARVGTQTTEGRRDVVVFFSEKSRNRVNEPGMSSININVLINIMWPALLLGVYRVRRVTLSRARVKRSL